MARSTAYKPSSRAVADLATERLAAYAAVASLILNMDEAITKE